MTIELFDPSPVSQASTGLFRTLTGKRLHIPGCPHVASALVEAGTAELLALEVCTWCRAELDGVGRTYYSSMDDALRGFGCHVGTHAAIREALRSVSHDQIWLPNSKSYVALDHEGSGVAWVGKGYVFVKATGSFLELPGYRDSAGGGTPRVEPRGDTCPVHFVATSLTGVCDSCD